MAPLSSAVTARVERRNIPTYPALAADPNPMFFENRNIQGSKGNIYPHPFTDQLSGQKVERDYQAVVLENEYLEMVLLPELGGRIFAGLDKTNGYDFFYRHKVIKPALIGLFGPWISGGMEFNWPQHHRPSTFDPTSYTIEEHPDGSRTVWMGEHDPLNRTKGMVGICLHPGKAYVETKVRLYNRTPFPQNFLWWANAGVHINERYQVIFPPDVHYAVFHVKNPVTAFPIAKGEFTPGLDYGQGTDISYWVNSPNAVSFFAAESRYEFFGGYDHLKDAGVVHVADAGVSPGKKYFTWANGRFGHQWNRNLMDDTGEYLELMAGVYTDNQPDFTWIMPYETRSFSQFWYPIQAIGGMKNANLSAALNLELKDGQALVGAYGVEELPGARVLLQAGERLLLDRRVDLGPGRPFTAQAAAQEGLPEQDYLLRILDASGEELLRYQPDAPWDGKMAEPYRAIPAPTELASVEELFLAGLHLEQYRHPTIPPERYWEEALRRDPGDSRVNLALGKLALRHADLPRAEAHFKTAVERLVSRNFNPYDGEAHYQLGLALQLQGRLDEAYKAFQKATWTYAWQSPAYYAMAQVDCLRGKFAKALEHLDRSLKVNAEHLKALNLKAGVLRRLGRAPEALTLASATAGLDPLDSWARWEQVQAARALGGEEETAARLRALFMILRQDAQTCLDIAFDCAAAGFYDDAAAFLQLVTDQQNLTPIAAYTLGWLAQQAGQPARSGFWFDRGQNADPAYCFPWRLEEIQVLRAALAHNPLDARAAYYLGNLLYDKTAYEEAQQLWLQSAALDPSFSIPWRNLGQAAFNRRADLAGALEFYRKARAANPADPRLLLEYDHLLQKKGVPPEERLGLYEADPALVEKRDDLTIRYMALLNRLGNPARALQIAQTHLFHAWEGGEGLVTAQYVAARRLLGERALAAGDAKRALAEFEAGRLYPPNLGEDPGAEAALPLVYASGLAYAALGKPEKARAAFESVLACEGGVDWVGLLRGKALLQLGKMEEGRQLLQKLAADSAELSQKPVQENYFYSGHPSPIFQEDPQKEAWLHFTALSGLALAASGQFPGAKEALGRAYAVDPSQQSVFEELRKL